MQLIAHRLDTLEKKGPRVIRKGKYVRDGNYRLFMLQVDWGIL